MFRQDPQKLGRKLAEDIERWPDDPHITDRVLSYLLKGADINAQGQRATPLVAAINSGDKELVSFLIMNGADVNRASRGDAPLLHAVGRKEMFDLLVASGATIAPDKLFESAINNNDLPLVMQAVEMGADIHSAGSGYYTNIGNAVGNGRVAIVEFLLDNGLNPNAPVNSRYKETLLHKASYTGNEAMVRMLVERGASLTALDDSNRTPLDTANYYNRDKVAAYLEERMQAQKRERENGWHKLAADQVARVTTQEIIGYKMTEIFNFRAGFYTSIAANIATGAETQNTVQFADCREQAFIEEAAEMLKSLGGQPPERGLAKATKLPPKAG
jgi:ankyrin repeat protein